MINVLFVSTYLARNGTEAFMMNVFRNLDREKYHVDFLIFSRKGIVYEEEIKKSGSSVFVLPPRKAGWKYYKSLKSFFGKNKYDVVHWCACSCTSIAPILYAYKNNIPVRIVHSHNSNCAGIHNKLLHFLLRPLANKMSTDRLACSKKAAKWFFSDLDARVLTNGILVDLYSRDDKLRQCKRMELSINNNTVIVGHVGRFNPVKNHKKIIEVFAEYIKIRPNALLMLVGTGDLESVVKRQVDEFGLTQKVLFMGERDDVPMLLQTMDCFLMPSLFEGLPFVLVEAQAASLPCLVSNTVDPQAKILESFQFLDLNLPAKNWAYCIDNMLSFKSTNGATKVKESGFSILDTTSILCSIYDKSINF